MSEIDQKPFPKGALIGAGVLLSASIALTALARIERLTTPQPAPEIFRVTPLASIDLSFADRADGAVGVYDAHSHEPVATLRPGEDGFVRGVMRGLARDRLRRHIGEGPPFKLAELPGGRLFLADTATGRVIDLEAFGAGNRDAFKRFLPQARPQSGVRS